MIAQHSRNIQFSIAYIHTTTTLCCMYFVQELDGLAKEAGVTLFNEIGLDPGIDHMLAMQCIDEVHDKGGKVNCTLCIAKSAGLRKKRCTFVCYMKAIIPMLVNCLH